MDLELGGDRSLEGEGGGRRRRRRKKKRREGRGGEKVKRERDLLIFTRVTFNVRSSVDLPAFPA